MDDYQILSIILMILNIIVVLLIELFRNTKK